jgi:hypothetical protein
MCITTMYYGVLLSGTASGKQFKVGTTRALFCWALSIRGMTPEIVVWIYCEKYYSLEAHQFSDILKPNTKPNRSMWSEDEHNSIKLWRT